MVKKLYYDDWLWEKKSLVSTIEADLGFDFDLFHPSASLTLSLFMNR